MRANQIKLGRNDSCPCGSGNKYKKCCLLLENRSAQENITFSEIELKKSQERLTARIQEDMGDKCIVLSGELENKMSEVILHLAEDLLKRAKTKSQNQKAIVVTCLAWNLAVMFDEKNQLEKLNDFIDKNINDLQDQQDFFEIVLSIIQKRNLYYSNINRIIIDHELAGSRNNFHLNVVSTVPEENIAGLT